MMSRVFSLYKVPLFLSFAVFVVLLALLVERDPLQISLIFIGSVFGTFVLDLDYILYAYFIEPHSSFAQDIQGYIKHTDLKGLVNYIYYHQSAIEDKTLNSALFQIVLLGMVFFTVSSDANLMVKALVVSAFVNSLYRMAEEFFHNRLDKWFWAFKSKPRKKHFYLYCTLLIVGLVYCLRIL